MTLNNSILIYSFRYLQRNFQLVCSISTWINYELEKSQATITKMSNYLLTSDYTHIKILIKHIKDTNLFNDYIRRKYSIREHKSKHETKISPYSKITLKIVSLLITNGATIHIDDDELLLKTITRKQNKLSFFIINNGAKITVEVIRALIYNERWYVVNHLVNNRNDISDNIQTIFEMSLGCSKKYIIRDILLKYSSIVNFDFLLNYIFQINDLKYLIQIIIRYSIKLKKTVIDRIFLIACQFKQTDLLTSFVSYDLGTKITIHDYDILFFNYLWSYENKITCKVILEDLSTFKILCKHYISIIDPKKILSLVRYGKIDLLEILCPKTPNHSVALKAIKYHHIDIVKKYMNVNYLDEYIITSSIYNRADFVMFFKSIQNNSESILLSK